MPSLERLYEPWPRWSTSDQLYIFANLPNEILKTNLCVCSKCKQNPKDRALINRERVCCLQSISWSHTEANTILRWGALLGQVGALDGVTNIYSQWSIITTYASAHGREADQKPEWLPSLICYTLINPSLTWVTSIVLLPSLDRIILVPTQTITSK